MNDINLMKMLLELKRAYQSIKQLSWELSQMEKRYPVPEVMTKEELHGMIKWYLSMVHDLEDSVIKIKKNYEKYKD